MKLSACLEEERQQAAADRQNLVAQITNLINVNGSIQEDRIAAKVDGVRTEMMSKRLQLQSAEKSYSTSMDVWSKKEGLLVEEVLKSRDIVKSRLKTDWTAVNDHNNSIQATTRSVHEETVRIVDAQMKDMAAQMQALDDFVTRARSQNELHHNSNVKSLERLVSSVSQSYSRTDKDIHSAEDRLKTLDVVVTAQTASLSSALPLLDSTLCEPLSSLRETILDAPMTEYNPSGDTPQKTQYSYPTHLPRTESHDTLLSRPRTRSTHTDDLPDVIPSPSKANVYADAKDDGVPARPATSDGGGLREITVNLNATTQPRASEPLMVTEKTGGENGFSSSLMGPPPFKRHATESKLPRGGKGVVKLEGRENEKLFSSSVGSGRRLRSSRE